MQVLRSERDLNRLAADDELGRKLQDAAIGSRARAPRRKSQPVQQSGHQRMTGRQRSSAGLRRYRRDRRPRTYGNAARAKRRAPGGIFLRVRPGMVGTRKSRLLSIPICSCLKGRNIQHSRAATSAFFSTPLPTDGVGLLMQRRENLRARQDDRTPRRLTEWDYLLGVHDETRLGALRLRSLTGESFLIATANWPHLHHLGA